MDITLQGASDETLRRYAQERAQQSEMALQDAKLAIGRHAALEYDRGAIAEEIGRRERLAKARS